MEKFVTFLAVGFVDLITKIILTYPILMLYNTFLVPAVSTLRVVTFWQAFGILVLMDLVVFTVSENKTSE